MSPILRIYGRLDLDGTHRAVIETDSPDLSPVPDKAPAAQFLRIEKDGRACGCLMDQVTRGPANVTYVDRLKQRYLNVRDGDEVSVEVSHLPEASSITLRVPSDFLKQDVARFVGKPLIKGERTALYTFSGKPRLVVVADTQPPGLVFIAPATDIALIAQATEVDSEADAEEELVRYTEVAGLDREIRTIREIIEYPLRFPQVFDYLGVPQPRGVILYGPPGTGKTLLARALANEVDAKFYRISGPEVFSMWYGQSEQKLRDIFTEASKTAPSVILIDELDALVPRRDQTRGELEQRIVATILTLMDGLIQLKGVVVLGTTNRLNSIDPALRREGRFGREIHIGVPDTAGRRDILKVHTRRMPLGPEVDLDAIAAKTVGFVGADLAALCREAAYNALRRSLPSDAFEKGRVISTNEIRVTQRDFDTSLPSVPPSAMREFLIEIPKVSWDDIGGLRDVKRLLRENIAYAITKRDVFEKAGVTPAKGILLYGPPGTGKTLLAKAVANECGVNFIAVRGPEMRSKWVGEAEERIRFLFARAREAAPCVIFIDEIDAAVPARGRDVAGVTDTIVNQILSEMDGIETTVGVWVIGATNRPELLDPAILRSGRFDYSIEIPLPDPESREAIFSVHLKGKPLASDIDVRALVELTDGLSGADIAGACRGAAWDAVRDAGFQAERVEIAMSHLRRSILRVKEGRAKLASKPIGYRIERRLGQ